MKRTLTVLAILFATILAQAQVPESPALFTIGNEKVSKDEFVKVYQKTNISGEADFSEKSLRDYLDLYVNFRLKVKQARDMKLDTTAAVLNEFKTYRSKLTPSYMYDTAVVREAYNRMKTDVHVEHILVKLDPNATPADTLKAFKKISAWRKMIVSGKKNFNTLAADSSSDPTAKDNKGDLGWITSMQVIYPFETIAYTSKPGTVSMPVRTRFGYHLIRTIETRPTRGTVTVAHLFIKLPNNATDEDKQKAKNKIDSLSGLLKAGGNWDELVKQYSQDKTSSASGGKLAPFGTGQMVGEFENTAFGLKNPGDVSSPVQTKFGWHIIKLIEKKPMGTFESMKDDIRKKVETGTWSEYAKQSFINKLKKEYKFKEIPGTKDELRRKMDSSLLKGNWSDSMCHNMITPLFALVDARYRPGFGAFKQNEFADFIVKNQRKYMNQGNIDNMYNKMYDQFVVVSVTGYEDQRLEAKYPPFSDLMDEYMNGILLFDLASEKVWTKAVEDTVGLKEFYEANKNNYMGQERAEVTTYTAKSQVVVDQLSKYIAKGTDNEDILAKINKKDKDNLTISTEEFEKGKDSEIEKLGWEAGKTYTVKTDSSIRLLKVNQLLPPAPKPLNEVKGYVVADYQESLEKSWIADLRKKYPVSINEQVFQSMVKK
ncbi:MAG: peptidylprolyl isomerase [Chitinophagaceae bacterium]|nr:peptidylprolyl isomerase [Chitinophagaceae bacterium]